MVVLAAASVTALRGETTNAVPVRPVPPHSVFVMPANAREGRDPFFPESTRPYEEAVTTKTVVDASAFTVKGISFENGRAMAIINNHTFAVGDEGEVLTGGKRVNIRVAEIRGGVVVIEVNGAKRELTIGIK
jgi:hypothetical protein